MAEPDDIDKLLREIDAMNASSQAAQVPAPRATGDVATTGAEGRTGGRWAWAGASAVGAGLAGGVLGTVLTFLPAMSTLSTAVGAALGGALVGFVSGPPRWFNRP